MNLFTLILLPTPPPSALPMLTFYHQLLLVPPQTLGLTLAAITLGLLLLRRLDPRPAPLLFRAAAVLTAALALASLTGLAGVYWPLATATGGVLLLLLDEAVHVLACAFTVVANVGSDLGAEARRLLTSTKARSATTRPVGKEVQ